MKEGRKEGKKHHQYLQLGFGIDYVRRVVVFTA
jgi:hypothetical protein